MTVITRLQGGLRPGQSAHDKADVRRGHTVPLRDTLHRLASFVCDSNISHLGDVEFRPRTTRLRHAALLNRVGCVFCTRAEKQVIWANTCRVVAGMAHAQAFSDRPIRQDVRDAVSSNVAVVNAEKPVSECVLRTSDPIPTRVRLSDFRPKPFLNIAGLCGGATGHAAKLPFPGLRPSRLHKESLRTIQARLFGAVKRRHSAIVAQRGES